MADFGKSYKKYPDSFFNLMNNNRLIMIADKTLLNFKLVDISTYRDCIMGVAILWIITYHYEFEGLLAKITDKGFVGVDMFIFVSGFGLFYSMAKNNDVLAFYRKRVIRIIPMYYIMGLINEIATMHFTLGDFMWKYSTLGFWTDGNYGFGWFIPSIIALYLFYPFIHRTIFNKENIETKVLIIIFSICSFFIIYDVLYKSIISVDHFLLLYRLPIFLGGAFFAYKLFSAKETNNQFLLISIFVLPLVLIRFASSEAKMVFLSTSFVAPIVMVLTCSLVKKIVLLQTVRNIGKASLEIFFIHLIVYTVYKNTGVQLVNYNVDRLVLVILVLPLGIVVHEMWSRLLAKF